jgi:hypothetical protein
MWLFLACASTCLEASSTVLDYAALPQKDSWLRHPIYGDPSFDTFQRHPGNPIRVGGPPHEWPVNGFLFHDPVSGNRYVYVGLYAEGYAMLKERGSMGCVAYRSTDDGATWAYVGTIWPDEPFRFEEGSSPIGHAPDVSVVYENGRYHMIYDWATEDSDWSTIMNPQGGADSGIGYAWAERPEGPFIRTAPAVYSTRKHPTYRGKYRRGYAATLLRRTDDWLVLAMMDSAANMGWALVGMTAKQPEGPYSEPVFLRAVEDAYYHPPLLEFFPAFQYEGYVYAPATSVALNRNYQAVFRAPVEQAMDPEAWRIFQDGSVWHAADVSHEYYGIWGQTFSGHVDEAGMLHVMFPSRNVEGRGTINLASRPWNAPYRERGFVMTGHGGASLTVLKSFYQEFALDAAVELRGKAAVLWAYQAPLGPNRPTADATLHALMRTRHCALELGETGEWAVAAVDEVGAKRVLGKGAVSLPVSPGTRHSVNLHLAVDAAGAVHLLLNGEDAWCGHVETSPGMLGLLVEPHSHLGVDAFAVEGEPKPATVRYLATEAIVGAGEAAGQWEIREDPGFTYGTGAVSVKPRTRAKWNLEGRSFVLWAPKGPDFGRAEVFLDGVSAGIVDHETGQSQPSSPLMARSDLPPGRHAVVVQATQGVVPLDFLEVGL